MWRRIRDLFDDRILRHFRESRHPVGEVAMGSVVGLFWALTPLVGVQMTLVAITWGLFRVFRARFTMSIAMAWVWISNPLTMPALYYAFYITGYGLFRALGADMELVSFTSFSAVVDASNAAGWREGSLQLLRYMVFDLGWPMLVGGFAIGVPAAILGYPLTVRSVNRLRTARASKMGLTLAEWENRFVRGHPQDHEPHRLSMEDFYPDSIPELLEDLAGHHRSSEQDELELKKAEPKSSSTGRSGGTEAGARAKRKKSPASKKKRSSAPSKKKKRASARRSSAG